MADALADLGEGVALEIELNGLDAMAQRPAGILLLGAQRHNDPLPDEGFQIPVDGA